MSTARTHPSRAAPAPRTRPAHTHHCQSKDATWGVCKRGTLGILDTLGSLAHPITKSAKRGCVSVALLAPLQPMSHKSHREFNQKWEPSPVAPKHAHGHESTAQTEQCAKHDETHRTPLRPQRSPRLGGEKRSQPAQKSRKAVGHPSYAAKLAGCGIVTVTRVPSPGLLSRRTWPSIAAIAWRTIDRPSPVPRSALPPVRARST